MRRRSLFRRFLDRIRFGLELTVVSGVRYRLLLAAALVAIAAIGAGLLMFWLDPSFQDIDQSTWWAFLRLTDTGYLGDDQGFVRRAVSTIVTVLGSVLFLGMLVAILTQWLNQTIEKLESGVTPIALRGHVILLGWTHRTPIIVEKLLLTRDRVQRFLSASGSRDLRIVILAERVDTALSQQLRERLGSLWNRKQVLLRSGTPLRLDHLERVAFRDAAALILPGADFAERNPDAVDAQTIKTLVTVSRNAREAGAKPPLAVAEIYDERKAALAHRVYAGESAIVAADHLVSRLIAQSLRQRGVCAVFKELLSLHEGNAIYVRQLEGQAGSSMGSLYGRFQQAILLGVVHPDERRVTLNPSPDSVLGERDRLVFVARHFEDCEPEEDAAETPPVAVRPERRTPVELHRRLLVLGWSRKLPALLQELAGYGEAAYAVDVVSSTPIQERERQLARHGIDPADGRTRHIEAGYSATHAMDRLDVASYDVIVMLASERLEEEEEADATTAMGYLLLRGLLPEEGPRPELLVELLDSENAFLFAEEDADVIVSPVLVSYVLSQVALRPELAMVFEELTRPWATQIDLLPAQEYLGGARTVRFGELERAARARGETALGLLRGAGSDGLALNPDRGQEWQLQPGDEVVVLASYSDIESQRTEAALG